MKKSPAKNFQDLTVWKKSHQFVLSAYKLSGLFPKTEIYGLTSQLRRAAVSIPANIAEGFRKRTKPDKARLFNVAQGSIEECRYYLILSNDLGYGETSSLSKLLVEVSKLLDSYMASMMANDNTKQVR